ncbi:MAG TPA: nuclear transport factor 2 family protein [Chthoniobacterales bacterium]|jgi:ketosteroid isomerase-like protein
MNTRHLVVLFVVALLPISAFSQTDPGSSPTPATTAGALASPSGVTAASSSAPDGAELTQLLKDFLAGASRNDIALHERFWADDVIYTSSSGKRRGKADILSDVRKESATPATNEKTVFSAEEIRIQQYGDTAIVAFRLVGTTTKAGKTETLRYLNTGTFLKRNDKWQVVAWQATKMPVDAEK